MSLAELQADFQKILLSAESRGADWVAESRQHLSSKQRIDIYHNAYRVRLIDILYDTFAHTAAYLGDDWFQSLAASYVEANVSKHRNIGLYGKAFSDHLAEQLPNDLEVAELAHMDWTLRRTFDGADAEVVTKSALELQVGSGERINAFLPVPTLSISTQNFNTLDIWHAINSDETPPVVQRLSGPVHILIWRKGHSPHFRSLSEIEAAAVNYLFMSYDFETIGEALYRDFPDTDVITEFGIIIARWLEDELLTQ